jgi:molybdate transport system regulatory protein
MKPMVKTYLVNEEREAFWGYGPVELLKRTERTGSLRKAAQEMDMAYTKAMKLLHRAEDGFGCKLLERKIGGAGGGGSVLTPQARQYIAAYEQYRRRCIQAAEEIFAECFSEEKEKPTKTV